MKAYGRVTEGIKWFNYAQKNNIAILKEHQPLQCSRYLPNSGMEENIVY